MTKALRIMPVPEVIRAAGAQVSDTTPPSAASAMPGTGAGVLTAVSDEPAEIAGTGAIFDDV